MLFDVAIVGAGIAGASIASELAPFMSVILIEMEDRPGYHSTGRSAAFWSETYGGPMVQPLTTASGAFLARPDRSFSEKSFLAERGALYLGQSVDAPAIAAFVDAFSDSDLALDVLDAETLTKRWPKLMPAWDRGVWDGKCADIDVAALHAAYLAKAGRHGAVVACRDTVEHMSYANGLWWIQCSGSDYRASRVVNAAGAWVDHIAKLADVSPIGITPYRRTISRVRVDGDVPADLPLVLDINGSFYFKPDTGGRIWLSPHDETPTIACDVAPEELDIAIAIDRFEKVMDWPVLAVEHSWAGLRSFAPDRLPVFGPDPGNPQFFWSAGQGGFGIQTAPAIAKLLASQILGQAPDEMVGAIDPTFYAPGRFAVPAI